MVLFCRRNYLFMVLYLASVQDIVCSNTIRQCGCLQKITNATSTSSCKIGASKHELGKIDIEIPYISTLGSGEYRIIFTTNEYINNNTKCDFSLLTTCKRHSVINYSIYEPQQCMACPYQTIPTVTFQYVFSGLYNLKIVSTDFQCTIDIKTDYKKEYLTKSATDVLVPTQSTQKIEVIMHSSGLLRPPNIYTSLMEENCNHNNCMKLKGVTHIYADGTGSNNYKEEFRDVSENTNVTWNCSYKNDSLGSTSYICTPVTLKPGNYSFTFDFTREICTEDLQQWLYHNVCTAYSILKIDALDTSIVPTYKLHKDDTYAISIVCSIAGVVLVVAIFVVPIYIHRRFYIPPSSKPTSESIETETSLLPLPEVIVIYAQDNPIFENMIEALLSLLRSVENTTVIDINVKDDKFFQQPQDWIRCKLLEKNTKIVLFLNNRIVDMYENRRKDMNSKWQDGLILYTIAQLQFSKPVDYTNLFIIHLSNITRKVEIFEYFNPATRYIMPNTIQTLLQHIFKSSGWEPNINDNLLYNFNRLCKQCIESIDDHNV